MQLLAYCILGTGNMFLTTSIPGVFKKKLKYMLYALSSFATLALSLKL